MRIAAISDTHGLHRLVTIPEADVLIHAGDILLPPIWHRNDADFIPWLTEQEKVLVDFNEWLGEQPVQHRIVIPGNHDWLFWYQPRAVRAILTNAIMLEDSGTVIDGFRFWGSPWQPAFNGWAFNLPRRGLALRSMWDLIPNDLDVLITHGPPYGILDRILQAGKGDGSSLGDEELRLALNTRQPTLHIFGHIHTSAGSTNYPHTRFVNASFVDEDCRPAFGPIMTILEAPRG